MPFRYPIALELQGRLCLVIGGGEIAEHKVRALLSAGGRVRVIAEETNQGVERLSRRGKIELIQRRYSTGDLAGAFLVVAATDDPSVNALVFDEASERNILINAVDDIPHCNFAVPSVVRRGDLTIAISTGGKAPALAKRLRLELSEKFGPEFGALVDLLGEVREETIGRRSVDFDTWANRWQEALDEDLIGFVRSGRKEEARRLVRAHLQPAAESRTRAPRSGRVGRVWIVGAGPGAPDLITVRGKALIDRADVVVYDRLVHPDLVAGKSAIFVGKSPGRKSISQGEINDVLIKLASEGQDVVRLKGGDPFVFGRGAEEAEALAKAGIEFDIVPGVTSAIAAPAAAGIPVTDRRFSSSVAIVTGHSAGGGSVDWSGLAESVDTIVVLMGVETVREITAAMLRGGMDPPTPTAIIENATTPEQRVFVTTLERLADVAERSNVHPPAVVIVGDVVSLSHQIAWIKEKADQQRGDVA